MNMTDVVLQMAIQNISQVQDLSKNDGATEHAEGQPSSSFQELLEQQRQDVTQSQEGTPDQPESKVPQEETLPDQSQATAVEAILWGWLIPNANQTATDGAAQGMTQDSSAMTYVQVSPVQLRTEGYLTPGEAATVMGWAAEPVQQGVQPGQTEQPGQTLQEPEVTGAQGTAAQALPTPETGDAALLSDQTKDGAQEFSGAFTGGSQEPMEGVTVQSWEMPLFRDLEAAPVRVGDAQVDMTAPAQEVETQMAQTLKSAVEQGSEYLKIKLTPDHLGTVVAEFARSPEGVLHVVLHVESEQTAKLLGDHVSALGALLQDGNSGQVQIEVSQPQQQESWQQFNQDGRQQQQHQQQPQRHTPEAESESFLQQLRLGLVEVESAQATP